MIAHTLDDSVGPGIPNAESLSGAATEIGLSAGRTVEDHVAYNDVLFSFKCRGARGVDDHPAAGQSLADIIVGIPFKLERHSAGKKGAKALAGGAGEPDVDGAVGEAVFSL